MNDKVVLEVRGIVKDFPGLRANDNISFQLHEGEILTLLGENGAGKTTLMNIIMGIYKPDAGEILVNGEPVHISDPREANRLGIGMVHQHFKLVGKHRARRRAGQRPEAQHEAGRPPCAGAQ